VQKVEWFKLQLMMSGNTYIDPINLPPLPPGKSEIDVAADYLYHLRQAMRNQLQKTLGEVFNREERNIRYYLTVPAIWNDAAKAATRAAAIQAGFLRDENDNRLTLVTEPEAAAMFCSKTGLLNLKIHDAVLIVDCGGGTVDLIAYEVEEEQPFSVSECTAGSGDSCGSTALNRNFSNILRAKIRKMKLPDGSRTAGKVYAKCIMDFENRIKADFRNNGQKWAVDVGIEAEFPEAGIEEGYMTFTNEEILQCFEPVVNRILELVRNQIIAIQAQNRNLQVCDRLDIFYSFTNQSRIFSLLVVSVPLNTSSNKSSCTSHPNSSLKSSDLWTLSQPSSRVQSQPVLLSESSLTVSLVDTISWQRCNLSRKAIILSSIVCRVLTVKIAANTRGKSSCRRVSVSRLVSRTRSASSDRLLLERLLCTRTSCMLATMMFAPNIPKIHVSIVSSTICIVTDLFDLGIKEVVTLTSDLSRKNLEKDFERMDTPQGTFYRVYFDIYLTLDGSELSAELVCQGEVMGRCSARFR
jgi:Hsp70 protein